MPEVTYTEQGKTKTRQFGTPGSYEDEDIKAAEAFAKTVDGTVSGGAASDEARASVGRPTSKFAEFIRGTKEGVQAPPIEQMIREILPPEFFRSLDAGQLPSAAADPSVAEHELTNPPKQILEIQMQYAGNPKSETNPKATVYRRKGSR
jgi:hypothetical protein